jgi:hypothetical protein
MLCPLCNEELVIDGEWSDSDCDFIDSSTVTGTVEFNLFCTECTDSLTDFELEFEQDVSDFVNEHEDHCRDEFTCEVQGETFAKRKDAYGNEHVGCSFTIYVHCICNQMAMYEYADDAPLTEVLEGI